MDPTARALYEVLRRITLCGPDAAGKLHLTIETDDGIARLQADAESVIGKALLDWNAMAGATMAAAELEKGRDPNLESRHIAPDTLKDFDRELREILPPGAHYVAAIVTPDGQLMASASATLQLFKPVLEDLLNEPVTQTPFSELPDRSKRLN